ncbi:transposable element Tcb2 transposase [Trichonephila clavipes]|nr:transposable element Tcb2 transposase [Trichonephila clavipes]
MTNRLKRIAFEKDHIHKPLEFWRTVVFSDEGKFRIFGIKGCKLVLRKPCAALQKKHIVPTLKHGGDEVMESATKLGLGKSFRFQHDNDPKHTAEIVKRWLLYNVPNQLYMAPQSSDLNPAEHL